MGFDGFFRDGKLSGDLLVCIPGSDLTQNFQFTLRELVVNRMRSDRSGDFIGNAKPPFVLTRGRVVILTFGRLALCLSPRESEC